MPRFARSPFAAALLTGALLPGAALTLAGCNSDGDGQTYGTNVEGTDDEAVHAEAEHPPGPHGGTVLELTTDHKLHGELLIDSDDPARAKFYVLAGDVKTPVKASRAAIFFNDPATGEETNLALDPVGEANADSAEWSFLRDRLPNGGEGDLEGRVEVEIDGESYETAFDTGEHAHGEHGHDHGDHAHDDGHAHGEHDHE